MQTTITDQSKSIIVGCVILTVITIASCVFWIVGLTGDACP